MRVHVHVCIFVRDNYNSRPSSQISDRSLMGAMYFNHCSDEIAGRKCSLDIHCSGKMRLKREESEASSHDQHFREKAMAVSTIPSNTGMAKLYCSVCKKYESNLQE